MPGPRRVCCRFAGSVASATCVRGLFIPPRAARQGHEGLRSGSGGAELTSLRVRWGAARAGPARSCGRSRSGRSGRGAPTAGLAAPDWLARVRQLGIGSGPTGWPVPGLAGNRQGQMVARGDATASVSGEPQSSRSADLNQASGEGGPRENRNRHIEQAGPRGAASHRRRALSGIRRVRNDAACRWGLLCRPVRRRAADWSRTHRGSRVRGRTGSANPHRRGVAGRAGPISGQPATLGLKCDAAHYSRRLHHATRSRTGRVGSDS